MWARVVDRTWFLTSGDFSAICRCDITFSASWWWRENRWKYCIQIALKLPLVYTYDHLRQKLHWRAQEISYHKHPKIGSVNRPLHRTNSSWHYFCYFIHTSLLFLTRRQQTSAIRVIEKVGVKFLKIANDLCNTVILAIIWKPCHTIIAIADYRGRSQTTDRWTLFSTIARSFAII